MTIRLSLAWIFTFVFLASMPARPGLAKEPMPGAWTSAAVTNAEVVAAATFAIQEEEKNLQKANAPTKAALALVSILTAEQQVVAGMNYRLTMKVKMDGKDKTAVATVWWQAWNKEEPYKLTSWKWQP